MSDKSDKNDKSEHDYGSRIKGRVTAIVLAAGRGSRMHSEIPKQFMMIDRFPTLYYSLMAFQDSTVDSIVLVTNEDSIDFCREELVDKYGISKVADIVAGGAERFESVSCGLRAAAGADYVLIHDSARPCIDNDIIETAIEGAVRYRACTVGVPVKDTIKVVDENGCGVDTPDRSRLWQIQTPQSFEYALLADCYSAMEEAGDTNVTDDTMIVERYSEVRTKVLMGNYRNIKITTPEDLVTARNFLLNSHKKSL